MGAGVFLLFSLLSSGGDRRCRFTARVAVNGLSSRGRFLLGVELFVGIFLVEVDPLVGSFLVGVELLVGRFAVGVTFLALLTFIAI